ncbi:MAG TPA: fused MFS/spermidine synthase, partial [Candidatus Eisenbacteria bacterium]|nr:fused MFS/spermidine synthase [Candidatus Eisenbacteria bacterium]
MRRSTPTPTSTPPPTPRIGIWLALFAASGCSALIYEIVWFQLLGLVVGSSAISLGILLGTFMGGLSLGSVLLPRLVPARHAPLRVYALLELGIAALGVVVFLIVPLVGHLYTGSGAHGPWGVVLRAAIAGLCLLPPTTLMGATLPAIARGVETTPEGAGKLGALYAANIAGGILGCLGAGFYLLRVFDVAAATLVAAALNVLVAAIAWRITVPAAAAAGPATGMPGARVVLLVVIALSGLSALGGQVVWTRNLALLLGGTVYTFSIILAVYLAGLGIGSAMGATRARTSPTPDRDLGVCQLMLALAIAWSAFMIHRSLPYWPVAPSLSRSPWVSFQLDLVRCLWAILPPTLFWGASVPLAIAAATGPGRDLGRVVGAIYAANTVGAIAGALGFSLIVMPAFGTLVSQQVMIAVAAAAGLLLLAPRVARAS